MAEQEIKQKQQQNAQKENPLERKDVVASSPLASSSPKAETTNILKETRIASNVQNSQQLAFNALFKTETATATTKNTTNNPANKTSKQAKESRTDTRKSPSNDNNAEIREQLAIKTATTQRNVATGAGKAVQNANAGTVADLSMNSQSTDQESSLQHSGMTETIKSSLDQTSTTDNNQRQQISPENALNKIELNPASEVVKLLDIVGPEAVLTFKEKLMQVWVTLDANSIKDLDVIARKPATLTGMSAMELLMVESPQGIHFVAFLKNSNDFEILATFDRRALLPDSASKQLIEAALMSYEQMDTVFKDGGNRIESKVKELAATRGTHDQVFQELQRLMVNEKRRRRKFRGMIDYLIDQLDQLDLEENADEDFIPKKLGKDKSGISKGRLESELEEEEELGAGIKPDDNDSDNDSDFH